MIAFIAAEPFEIAPLERRRTSQAWLCLARGPGFKLARAAAQTAAAQRPSAIVSVGLCGALTADLRAGDIVVDTAACQPRNTPPHKSGKVVSQDRVAVTPAEKRQLAQHGIAVEMESAAVRQVAGQHNIPFYSVKVVSDLADEQLPLDFNAYRDEDGRFRKSRIALAALSRPWLLPRLIHVQRNAQQAVEKLGEFLVHCEF
jgi:adenosylhomocysteine nucleosidase